MRILESKKIIIGFLVGALLLLMLLMVAIQRPRTSDTTTSTPTQNSPSTQTPDIESTARALPPIRVAFNNYQINTSVPTLPEALTLYTFKTNYSEEEAQTFANTLELTSKQLSSDKRSVIFSNLTDPEKRGMLTFNLNTGAFIFQSFGNHQPRISLPQQSPLLTAQLFVQELGFDEPTLRCLDTYERTEAEGRVFVECHRSLAGATVIGFPGVLNISEDTPLNQLKIGQSTAEALNDKTIINTSNNSDGKVRSDDSNTITVEIAKDNNRILSVISNIREVEAEETVSSSDLLTPQEALLRFENNASEVTAALPAGRGTTDTARFFSTGQVSGKQASITDYLLVYPEKPASITQKSFVPYYLVRGVGTTTAGLPAKFVQLLPATKRSLSFIEPPTPEVAGTYIAQNNFSNQVGSQKQGGFEIKSSIVPTQPGPTLLPSTPLSPTIAPILGKTPEACTAPTGASVSPLKLQIPGVGEMEVLQTSAHMFFFKSATFPIGDMQQIRQQLYTLVEDQYAINVSHWLTEDSSFQGASLASSANAYNVYNQINLKLNTLRTTPGRTVTGLENYEAPLAVNTESRLKTTADNVAQKLITAQQQGSITSFAQRPNIFPASVLNTMHFVLTAVGGEENDGRWGTACYISGSTPSIFVYSGDMRPVSITMPESVTFSYPALNNKNTWNITTPLSSYLYYEYDNAAVNLSMPKEGWVVKVKDIKSFVNSTIVKHLGLTQKEQERLHQEVQLALHNQKVTDDSYLQLSLANQEELNGELPLEISPEPTTVQRIHILMKPVSKQIKLTAPQLSPLERSPYMILELGARVIE